MEEYYEKRSIGLIRYTGFMALVFASQIGLFVLITVLQVPGLSSVILFVAGLVGSSISYAAAVLGGVPLPPPKRSTVTDGVPLPGSEKSSVLGGVPLPGPKKRFLLKDMIRFTAFMALVLASQIGMFVLICGIQENSISLAALTLFFAGIVGTATSYVAAVKGGVPPPGPKGRETDKP